MKILQISFVAMLMIMGTSFAATAKTINLLENFATSDESQMCDKSKFYEKWECYWKEGEAVPEESRPSSYYSILKFNESGQGLVSTLTEGKKLLLSGINDLEFEDGMHVVVLDYPSSSDGKDFYYRIPINVPQTGKYKLTGSLYNVSCQGIDGSIPSDFNTATYYFAAIFTSETDPCKKEFKVVDSHFETTVNGTKKFPVYHIVRYNTTDKHGEKVIYVKPMELYIQLDKEDKYLCIYAPPTLENKKTKSVLVLGNMRLEPVDPIVVPEPEPEPLYFKHFARTLFEMQSYSLKALGLEVPQGFDTQASKVSVTCDDDKRFKLEGEGLNTVVKVVGTHIYEGGDKGLPYATLTVSYQDESGVSQSAKLKLHVPTRQQTTWTTFDFTQSGIPDSAEGNSPEVCISSDTGAWKAYFVNDDPTLNANDTNSVASGTQPTYTYQEGEGWRIDFGNEVGRFTLRFDANMAESHYTKNPAYTLDEIWLNIYPTSAQNLRVLAAAEIDGKTEYKELETDIPSEDRYVVGYDYFVGHDASMSKEIVIEASGSVTLKNAYLSFANNFEIPMPIFMNVSENNNENTKDTYIRLDLPKDENGKEYWDNNNKLQIQYLIEADPDAIGTYGPETDTNTVSDPVSYSDSDTPTWHNYTSGQKVTCERLQKITARVVHPHGMISLPKSVDYSVVTSVEDLQIEDSESTISANCTRYFTLQGIETSEPQGDIYIMVKEGKTYLVRK